MIAALFLGSGPFQSAAAHPAAQFPDNTKIGAYFFYWHDCPANNCMLDQMKFHPTGSYPRYSSLEKTWYAFQIQDMWLAGIDYVFPICWGDHPGYGWFRINTLANLSAALTESGLHLKIGLFDDSTSECCEWNYYNGRGYDTDPLMPLSDSNNWSYFYDKKIKKYFQTIPASQWATHNGRPVGEGGRPIIIVYSAAWFTGQEFSDDMWAAIKTVFSQDFKTSQGQGIIPFLVLENSWFVFNPDVAAVADGRYAWGAAMFGQSGFETNGYGISAVGPGYDDRLIRTPGQFHDRNKDINQNPGSEDVFLKTEFAKIPKAQGYVFDRAADTKSLILIETWNELWEATPVERCSDYPANGGGVLPPDFYIKSLGDLARAYKTPAAVLKSDLAGTWDGQGVYFRSTETGTWTPLALPADKIACGDLFGDGRDDLLGIWSGQAGVWVRNSLTGAWSFLSSAASQIAVGDMNGDGRSDFVGTWTGQGVYYRNSIGGAWTQVATPADLIAAGDLDGDGTDDLIGVWSGQAGVWAKFSREGNWLQLGSSARDIATGDMNGDGRTDLVGTWDGQGVFYRDSVSGAWTKIASPADQVAAGDFDGDTIADLAGIWPGQAGVWIKSSATGQWDLLASSARDISAGRMAAGSWGSSATACGPSDPISSAELAGSWPGREDFVNRAEKNLEPRLEFPPRIRIPGPGEPGFRYVSEKTLRIPGYSFSG
jgi:hypothetical protein